ncbi:hypothetical protein BDR03DRAFT_972705 [Suillus americanus]|nr:hypothetical protein BDR03DRAFT_972705 [Suillus americanus]
MDLTSPSPSHLPQQECPCSLFRLSALGITHTKHQTTIMSWTPLLFLRYHVPLVGAAS